ncbi:hypothetical protein L1887_15183 [Cichorium endivia]|nr:hypothetical protein L1887_15183 [Cichorium endivia]
MSNTAITIKEASDLQIDFDVKFLPSSYCSFFASDFIPTFLYRFISNLGYEFDPRTRRASPDEKSAKSRTLDEEDMERVG